MGGESGAKSFLFGLTHGQTFVCRPVCLWGKWPNGLSSFRQVTEVKLGQVRSNSGWVTSEA